MRRLVRHAVAAGAMCLASILVADSGPAAARPGPDVPEAGSTTSPEGLTTLAFQQRSIQVNRRRIGHEWRCSTKKGNTVYFTTGFVEGEARRALEAYVGHPVSCFREEEFFF